MFIANAQLTSMLKILSDPIINHTIRSSTINTQVLATLLHDLLVFYHFATKSIQNNQNLQFSVGPPHKSGKSTLMADPMGYQTQD